MKKEKAIKPAILGGIPAFSEPIPITKPTMPDTDVILSRYKEIFKTGIITNAKYVKEFEATAVKHLKVRNAIALSSCTCGLMLTMKCLELKGEVIIPSFTFHATAHAAVWNNLTPVFVDCQSDTFNVCPEEVEKAITEKTSAILATHIFGNPSDIDALEKIAAKNKLALIFDAAHGFGASYKGKPVGGNGTASVFSLSPTKLLTSAEGGIVTTNDDALAAKLKVARNYGDSGNYDCAFSGFNSRMSELHAILGIESLGDLAKNVKRRQKSVEIYKELLRKLPGISFQKIKKGNQSSFKDFSIIVDADKFGLSRDSLSEALAKENIVVKKYFYPPVHRQKAFAKYCQGNIKKTFVNTESISQTALSLPLYSHIEEKDIRKICEALSRIYSSRKEIKEVIN
ncbi:MAG: DegT/DnrJ/EryC1/StrS family aminotransferase [Candidatus Omnitrophica bacterium]|nr:DegT/DnrJ/EryC1/StrS family aminotransferase [Candidatus Omnitrophota bacterium]